MAYLRFYNTVDSTNKEARRLLAEGPVLDGLTLFAHEQTAGRGQYGRSWHAEPGAHLCMSVIHTPAFMPVGDLPGVNMKVALAMVYALQSIAPLVTFRIKWPNDIYAGDRKLCGLLIENSLSEGRVQHMIIGIGLNVNERVFPEDLPNPVSLHQLTGLRYDLPVLAETIRAQVMDTLLHPPVDWKPEYDRLLYGLHEKHRFQRGDESFDATIEGVDAEGRLLLKMDDGEVQAFGSDVPRFAPKSPEGGL